MKIFPVVLYLLFYISIFKDILLLIPDFKKEIKIWQNIPLLLVLRKDVMQES